MSKKVICPSCSGSMKDWGNGGNKHYKCVQCGNIYLLDYTGNLVQMFFTESNEKICEQCGYTLKNGEYTGAWENGNNPDSYVKCSHCGHANFL